MTILKPEGDDGAKPHFFDRPVRVTRDNDGDPYEEITIEYEAGGKIVILTDCPILFVEPERN